MDFVVICKERGQDLITASCMCLWVSSNRPTWISISECFLLADAQHPTQDTSVFTTVNFLCNVSFYPTQRVWHQMTSTDKWFISIWEGKNLFSPRRHMKVILNKRRFIDVIVCKKLLSGVWHFGWMKGNVKIGCRWQSLNVVMSDKGKHTVIPNWPLLL